MNERPLQGKVALVTGASRGIGRAIAARLGELGARLVLNYASDEAAASESQQRALAAGAPGARLAKADLGDREQAQGLVRSALETEGRVDILVNNAAVQRSALAHKMTDEDWQRVIDVNLSGVFYLCRGVLPGMLERQSGHIINIASVSSFLPHPKGTLGYITAKHGLIGLTKGLAAETAAKGVLVNAVAPGPIETDMIGWLNPEQRERLLSVVPMKRVGSPEEVARMVGFVATEVTYSTGNVFHVGGGAVMG